MNEVLEANAGIALTLSRKVGGVTVERSTAGVLGRTVFSRTRATPGGPSIEWGDADFLIRGIEYKFDPEGVPVEPAEGDRIRDQVSGRLFEIKPIPNEPAWRWSEPEKLTWRIHAKEIVEDAP
jgi:hypothetical protein